MRNVSDKICRENQNTGFMLNKVSEKGTVYEIMWENMAEPDGPQMTI
jgi:hypothetical protein